MDHLADLNPPLGRGGGPCLVIQRILDVVSNPALRNTLVQQIEDGTGLHKGEESKVYRPVRDKGPGGMIENLLFSPHVQYRMDLRGVTIGAVQKSLQRALKQLDEWRVKRDKRYDDVLRELRVENRFRWLDPASNLFTTVAPNGLRSVEVVTTFWKGKEDPPPPSPGTCSTRSAGYRTDDLSGYQTFVKDPHDQGEDHEKQQVLPSPPWTRTGPSETPSFNVPEPGRDKYRGPGTPGRPHPNEPARTSPRRAPVDAAKDGPAFPSGDDRQHEQRGEAKTDSKKYYQQHRTEKQQIAKKWYDKNKNKAKFRVDQDRRDKFPDRFERRPGGGFDSAADRSKEWRKEQDHTADMIERRPPDMDSDQRFDRGHGYRWPVDGLPADVLDAPETPDNPGSSRVIPDNHNFENRKAVVIRQILDACGPDVKTKASGIQPKLSKVDAKNGMWTFTVTGSESTYLVKVKTSVSGNVKDASKAQVQVACSCPFWQWQGPEHWAREGGYLYGKPTGLATAPEEKDPTHKHGACKHVVAVFDLILKKKWSVPGKAASGSAQFFADSLATGDVVIHHPFVAGDAKKLAARYLEAIRRTHANLHLSM